jgi:RecA/RadA recombinase
MQRKSSGKQSISEQVKKKVASPKKQEPAPGGNTEMIVSTGSTLLDLAISGGRVRGGGIPAGIMVEIFGPSSTGKSVMLSQIAGITQEMGGSVMFADPEGRLNAQFARIFKLQLEQSEYSKPDTVTEVFQAVRKWKPENDKAINAIFTDSVAALSTDMEMDDKVGDKTGMRRAKEFSQEFRRTCRMLVEKNYLMVCSNQIRDNVGEKQFSAKTISTGGRAMEHYPSLRLKTQFAERGAKMWKTTTRHKREIKKVVGVNIEVEVFKSSVWKPYGKAPVTIIFDYGVDDIRQNLQYLKTYTGASTYVLGDESLGKSLNDAIAQIEADDAEDLLRDEVIDLWEDIEKEFATQRKPKK